MQNVWQTARFKSNISGSTKTLTPDTCIRQDTNASADLNSARFHEMEKQCDYLF